MPAREEYAGVQPLDDVTPFQGRVFAAIKLLILELTDDQRAECELFADVSPGVRMLPHTDDQDVVEVRWADLVIGFVSASWLRTGVVPDDFGPPM